MRAELIALAATRAHAVPAGGGPSAKRHRLDPQLVRSEAFRIGLAKHMKDIEDSSEEEDSSGDEFADGSKRQRLVHRQGAPAWVMDCSSSSCNDSSGDESSDDECACGAYLVGDQEICGPCRAAMMNAAAEDDSSGESSDGY